ncbi:hypothetical protein LCGC14_1076870 [marine sediment metagenome]|uniref:Uncharacterized protein n=1 Tax=marine sediment metagenome TaxID=412755 RepID=A0A0F9MGH4_9ZZZZ
MIVPARGKVLVEIYSQKHSFVHLPETMALPKLSVAEIISGNGSFVKGQLILVPTKAGLSIIEDGIKYRLINMSDVVAEIDDYVL